MEQRDPPSAEELFLAVIERTPVEREGYLEAACRGDTSLRAEVEMLVACHEVAGDFLERSPSTAAYGVDDVDFPRLPERIGKFTIKRMLGEGGMGCVYLAESMEPRRQVALKVIRPGLGTPELMRRFRHEVQVVAVLQHPAVAQLYEAGAEPTPLGPLPWFAMEYVEGRTITAYAKGLGWRDRLALVARVAEGVHHAHQKGIIHRDLKPGNILVDGSGRPRILDFGVARLLEGSEGGLATVQTRPGQLVGTLAYMSPEQVSGDPMAVDARSDVYALGVIAYEMLAGRPAYDVASMSFADAVRAIREDSPSRLGMVDRRLRGDVEAVVEKAMAKEPERRYQSALEVAADIERCLADQPVLARRASAWYHVRKFARRNKALVGVGAVAVFSLVGGLGVSVWQGRVAERERAGAVASLEVSTAINEFMESLFKAAEPNTAKKPDMTVREALDRSTVEEVRAKFEGKPQVRSQLHGTIGRAYKALSLYVEAEPHLLEAERLTREHYAWNAIERFRALHDLGHLYKLQDRFDEGEPMLREAADAAASAFGPERLETIGCRNDLASLLLRRGSAEEAEKIFAGSVAAAERGLGGGHPTTLASLNNWGAALRALGRREEAIGVRRRLLTLCREHLGESDNGTITTMSNLGRDLLDAKKPEEAEPLLRRAVALRLEMQGPAHRSTLNTRCNLGTCLAALGRFEEAEATLADVARVGEERWPGSIDAATYRREYGRALVKMRRLAEGAEHLEGAYGVFSAALGEENRQTTGVAGELARVYDEMGMEAEAAAWQKKANP